MVRWRAKMRQTVLPIEPERCKVSATI